MDYLKDYTYYNDLYDLFTIKDCIRIYWDLNDGMMQRRKELKDMDDDEFKRELNKTLNWFLYTRKGERYRIKKETINEWMEKDKIQQDKYDNTPAPLHILCSICKVLMKNTIKQLDAPYEKPLRMMFCFECPKCKKRKWIMEDGSEWKHDPPKCSKCGKKSKSTVKRKGNVLTWTITCLSCGFKEVDIDDFDKKDKERKKREQKDKELLIKYRKEMCFDDKKGQEYIELMEATTVANAVHDEEMHKYDDPAVEQALKLKKTKIADIEKVLSKAIEKEKYIKLIFDKPEIDEFVIVPFTVEDTDTSRSNRDSTNQLEKAIKNTLEGTNWRLLTGSLSYRMGYLQGRLKGYEREEDLIKLFGQKKEVKPDRKITDEMRQKYSGNNLVQIARMTGQHDGIENMRKRRLIKEPEGFFLKEEEGVYTCSICSRNNPGKEIWWTPDSLRCADCLENVKNKSIPPLTWDHDHKIWFDSNDLQYTWSLHSSTIRKLQRLGVLKGRDLKTEDGIVYFTVFLVKENEEFLKNYPKKPKIKVIFK